MIVFNKLILDVAISAPYEDAGMVYLFRGSAEGLESGYEQKLVPSSFTPLHVRGFGLGMSRGADLNGDGHNGLYIKGRYSKTVNLSNQ